MRSGRWNNGPNSETSVSKSVEDERASAAGRRVRVAHSHGMALTPVTLVTEYGQTPC